MESIIYIDLKILLKHYYEIDDALQFSKGMCHLLCCYTNQHLLGVTGSHHIDAIKKKKNHENIFMK